MVNRVRKIWYLGGLIFLGFAIQIFGITMYDTHNNLGVSPLAPVFKFTGYAGIALSLLSPLFSIAALLLWLSVRRSEHYNRSFSLALFVSGITLVAILEFFWTISGHPVWYMAYAY